MPNKTFFWFFLPTGLAMILFIGLPIISTGIQSFYAQHDQVVKEVKKCDPFGCTVSIVVDNEETSKIREAKPLGKFNGFGTYTDRNHLAVDEIKKFWNETESFGAFVDQVTNLPFYKALLHKVPKTQLSLLPFLVHLKCGYAQTLVYFAY